MAITININGLTLCHRGSGGVSHNTLVRCAVKPRVAAQFENPAPVPNMTLGVTQFDK